jgi:hypothetical protein
MTDARTMDDPLVYTKTVVNNATFHAAQQGRTDLVDRLERHRILLDQLEGATVAVVGLCDAGKSSLINACIGQVVVPVDLVHPTPVPVVVSAGDGTVRLHRTIETEDAPGLVTGNLGDLDKAFAAPANQLGELRLVEVGCPSWSRPASLVFVDTPSQSIGTASARALLTGMDPDVLVLATDAAQELSQLELATIAAAQHHNTQLIIALTKIDLHPHWRRILDVNRGHLRQAGLAVPILPVSARLYDLGREGNDGRLSNESGIVALLDYLDQAATGAREVYVCSRALTAVTDATDDLAGELRSQRELLNDPEAAMRTNQQLLKARDRIERLRGAGAKWRERLYDGLQRLEMETDYDLRGRMTRLQTEALEEIEAIDPAASWPVFSTRLERLVDNEVSEVFDALAENSRALANDVAQLFGEEGGFAFDIEANQGYTPGELRLQGQLPDVPASAGGSVINAIRGSAASMSVTAIVARYGALVVGTAVVNVVLLPVGAAMTLLLGHHALKATRESRTAMQRRAATLAVRKYLDGVSPEVSIRMRSDLMSLRVEFRDHFEREAASMGVKVETEMRSALEAMRVSDEQREQRLAGVAEALQQLELVAAHAGRARTQLSATKVPA